MNLTDLGMSILILGILIALIGTLLTILSSLKRVEGDAKVRGGGVVIIGPIPIIFGSDGKWVAVTATIAFILIVLWLFFYAKF